MGPKSDKIEESDLWPLKKLLKQEGDLKPEKVLLTTSEVQLLADADSINYGFLKEDSDDKSERCAVFTKAIKYYERYILKTRERHRKAQENNNNGRTPIEACNVDPKVYCKLGHVHLLTEDYAKALSAYQKYLQLSKESWRDANFLYGLGLVYFHFNSHSWAERAFQQVLFVDPAFVRAKEVHLRLALIAKLCNDYQLSLKHFKLAEDEVGESSFPPVKIRFHVAHLHEIRGESAMAMEIYEDILKEKELPQCIKADVLRQIGWMYHTLESLGDKQTRLSTAVQYLLKSIEADPKSGQSLYMLGRCYGAMNKCHEAFVAYRSSVDKAESNNADTWCSIGVLYQQQSQPIDALQAFICAVQLDKNHVEAWINLGLLYESANQPQDALACYQNAALERPVPASVAQRAKFLKTQVLSIPVNASAGGKQKQLPSVEEAWNTQVTNEMMNRQPKTVNKEASPQKPAPPPQPPARPSFYLNAQQLATMQYMQNQQQSLTPAQRQLLLHLQQQYRLMQQHQVSRIQQQQSIQQGQQPTSSTANSENQSSSLSIGAIQKRKPGSGDNPEAKPTVKTLERLFARYRNEKQRNMKAKAVPTRITSKPSQMSRYRLRVDLSMKSTEMAQRCAHYANVSRNKLKIPTSILPDGTPPPQPPERPPQKVIKENLLPPTPSVHLENKKDVFSPQLQEFCLQHPITVVRGIAGALKLDCGLFSTKVMQEEFANHPIEVWTQLKQGADENWDPVSMRQVWDCPISKSHSTVGKYSEYQSKSFQSGLKEDNDKPGINSAFRESVANEPDPIKRKKKFPTLKCGANVSLSDNSKWRLQLAELIKLPPWIRVVSSGNMLSHIGYNINGMNTVKMYMKVPCSRIPAHQEENNLCLVNLNIGPGDCEWFGVPEEYWGAIKDLCDKHKINYLSGSWWPNMHELMEDEIPVYRFLQRPGDLVWVNSGCVYWVQAAGWCNNISWNVGPLTFKQFTLALERFEYNRLQLKKSAVGMIHLTWCIARNLRLHDHKLFTAVKQTLMQSLKRIFLISEYLKNKGIEIIQKKTSREPEPPVFCIKCTREVFCIVFIPDNESAQTVFCFECAISKKADLKGITVVEEIHQKELMFVYDNFKLHSPPGQSLTPQLTPPMMSPVHHHHQPALHHHHQYYPTSASSYPSDLMGANTSLGHYGLLQPKTEMT